MLVREFRRFRETVRATFPDRQIFVRTDGTVRFITFTTRVQVLLACLLFVFSGWVGLTTGNFLLKDKIVAAKDARIQRLASDYNTLNDEMLKMQQGVVASVDELKNRQQLLDGLVAKSDHLTKQIQSLPDIKFKPATDAAAADQSADTPAQDQAAAGTDVSAPDAATDVTAPDSGADADSADNTQSSNQRAAAASDQASASDDDPWWLFGSSDDSSTFNLAKITKAPKPGDPRWERYVAESVDAVKKQQDEAASKLLARIHKEYTELASFVDVTGLSADRLLTALDGPTAGTGGPEVDIKFPSPISEATAAVLDEDNGDDFGSVVQAVSRLDGLRESLRSMPLGKPVTDYYISSPFGKRRDPFSGRWAYHSGVDMAGYWKEPVHATVAGVVTFVGRHGPYGNMVEIDHGNGFKTRYGHLYATKVQKGEHVARGQLVGLMGNTGRSTGTHLHYEIWFKDKLQNPLKFFRAASYVIQN